MCTIIIQYTLQYTKKRHLAEDRQNTCNLMSSCFCYFDWEHTMLYSLKPEHVAAICFTFISFFSFAFVINCYAMDQMLGFGEDLLKLLKTGNFYTYWHITTFFCTAISHLSQLSLLCIHVFISWWKILWCISVSLCTALHNICRLTICRVQLYVVTVI